MHYHLFILSLLPLLLFGCSNHKQDDRLTHIAAIVSDTPQLALSVLDSINYSSLTEADQHFYDFLEIKATDKAYITHTSDSLVLKVIDYYASHRTPPVYPEALYYGGRVYSDLGDYPTALKYFQLSLDNLSSDTDNLDLKNRVFSQTGRLLNSLRLFDEAVPYITSAIEINRQTNDTINLIYNLQLLGGTCLRDDNYNLAEKYLDESLEYGSKESYESLAAISRMYLAAVKHKQGALDSALTLIRQSIDNVPTGVRVSAVAYASTIYLTANRPDSAYIYAHELIANSNTLHHQIGYQVLLSPQVRRFIHPDTLDCYISDYRTLLETFYDENNNQLAINQQNLYNYQLHERTKNEAERTSALLWKWITGCILLIFVMAVINLSLKNRAKKRIIDLQRALAYIDELEQELKRPSETRIENISDNDVRTAVANEETNHLVVAQATKVTQTDLRERLRDKLMAIYESSEDRQTVSPSILQSEPYQKLLDLIKANKALKDDDNIWDEVERVVLKSSPRFRTHLSLLTLGKVSVQDIHIALLIKCGIKPSHMTILLGRTNGAIISRRESLCVKVLDQKLGVKVIDGIIRLL